MFYFMMEHTMSDFKSKLPDLKELGEMTGKLFRDIKTSVGEIIDNYKQKHPQPEKTEPVATEVKTPDDKKEATKPVAEEKPVEEPVTPVEVPKEDTKDKE